MSFWFIAWRRWSSRKRIYNSSDIIIKKNPGLKADSPYLFKD